MRLRYIGLTRIGLMEAWASFCDDHPGDFRYLANPDGSQLFAILSVSAGRLLLLAAAYLIVIGLYRAPTRLSNSFICEFQHFS